MDLIKNWQNDYTEAGCDEVGRGCLAGPVVAASVILDENFNNFLIKDSKTLSKTSIKELAEYIKTNARDYAIAELPPEFIDKHNILNASIHAMHLALDQLKVRPEFILVDGNRFHPYNYIPHQCVVKGDSKVLSIAAASILAKDYRDRLMEKLHEEYPQYGWAKNVGYPTKAHRDAIREFGPTPYHRMSFKLL
ncbi:ribonuclease HII [Elizabethkingia anophelis]|uniref:Ribonuclease HII n=1 Tax=Elizabethkingia anophelis NUHP1 TaxID=1338011 RepID=A0A077ECA2_9FLAO|nr:ribonuclease HII [Elizabethkingia anophelis]AIL44338.1 Ribonuclease HII [Elizabethkingia anophelis NUHP1]MBE9394793.1 ribonuclease HII [Elizabethkingia anophelis]MBE9406587.1 ribonuclease HII [Elizabethkingia anophelis]BBQ07835.1 ribonuclease HII [Elizabethkingia anophelis]